MFSFSQHSKPITRDLCALRNCAPKQNCNDRVQPQPQQLRAFDERAVLQYRGRISGGYFKSHPQPDWTPGSRGVSGRHRNFWIPQQPVSACSVLPLQTAAFPYQSAAD